jgi:hypothetical protein
MHAIRQEIDASEAACMNGLSKIPAWTLKKFFRYLFNLKLLRQAVGGLIKKAAKKLIGVPLTVLIGTLGATSVSLIVQAVQDIADERGGIWTDAHEILENLTAEITGIVPAGRSLWQAPELQGQLQNRDGLVFAEGLVPPDTYQVFVQATPEAPFTPLLHPRNKLPATYAFKEGWTHTLYSDTLDMEGGRLKVRATAPTVVPA